jgi:hypothetical protein
LRGGFGVNNWCPKSRETKVMPDDKIVIINKI